MDQRLKGMVMIDCIGGYDESVRLPDEPSSTDPRLVALKVVQEIQWRLYGPQATNPYPLEAPREIDLDPNRICITFNSFARDQADCDYDYWGNNGNDGPGYFFTSNMRFFRDQDRLPGVFDQPDSFEPLSFTTRDDRDLEDPNGDGPLPGDGDIDPVLFASNRAYRHPFLINAGSWPVAFGPFPGTGPQPLIQPFEHPTRAGETTLSPLRKWMWDFVDEYMKEQARLGNLPNGTPASPTSSTRTSTPNAPWPGPAD